MDDDLNKPTKMKEPDWLRKALASTSGFPFFVANRAMHPTGEVRIPNHKLELWSQNFVGDALLVITTIGAIDEIGLQLGAKRQPFLDGEVEMVVPVVVGQLDERDWGGQRVDGPEEQARDGLRVVVVLATERIRGCLDREENTKRDLKYRRIQITSEMEPMLAGLSRENCFNEGQALLPKWFPGQTGNAVMKAAYREFASAPRLTSVACFRRIRNGQMELVHTAGIIYKKALSFLSAQHEMSAEMRAAQIAADALREQTASENASQLQETSDNASKTQGISKHVMLELVHARHDCPTIGQFMAAAIEMDINPARFFANVAAYTADLACGTLLGRAARGHEVWFKPIHCSRLQFLIGQADEADLEPELANETDKAAQRLRDLALRVKTRSGWDAFFAISKASNAALVLLPVSKP